ncbi:MULTISPECIES: hypothetical protein, partial [Roseibium]|uniref:hypothetical protein n=1 Tax=Roseibium TaxID=150830 RepID=UPI00329803DD
SRRSDQSPEDAQTRHVRSSRSRIVAGENATVPPHRLRQSRLKGNATLAFGGFAVIYGALLLRLPAAKRI